MRRRSFLKCGRRRLRLEHRGRSRLRRLDRFFQKRRGESIFAFAFEFEMERHIRLGCGLRESGFGFGMPPAHHSGVEPLLDDLAGAGFDHSLAPQKFLAMDLFVKVVLDAVGLLGCQEA